MKQIMRRTLKNRSGETLLETLVSVLIAVLALTLLAGMTGASAKLINRGIEVSDAYSAGLNNLASPGTDGAVYFYDNAGGTPLQLGKTRAGVTYQYKVDVSYGEFDANVKNEDGTDAKIIAYVKK